VKVYEFLETNGYEYAIRLPASDLLLEETDLQDRNIEESGLKNQGLNRKYREPTLNNHEH